MGSSHCKVQTEKLRPQRSRELKDDAASKLCFLSVGVPFLKSSPGGDVDPRGSRLMESWRQTVWKDGEYSGIDFLLKSQHDPSLAVLREPG